MALRAHQASFLAVVRAAVLMLLDALSQHKTAPHRFRINVAIKVNPLPAIQRPGLSAESFANSPCKHRLLNCSEVLASHTWRQFTTIGFNVSGQKRLFAIGHLIFVICRLEKRRQLLVSSSMTK